MAKQAHVTPHAQAPPYDGSVYGHKDISQNRSHNLQFKLSQMAKIPYYIGTKQPSED